jgi:formate dehydrogenase subunit delta
MPADTITVTQAERLVAMANQIARAFAAQGEDRAVPQIADHIRQFWDPNMRTRIVGHVAGGGGGLDILARKAIDSLQ